MSISERINPDNLNIHHFQEVPEARPELPFDIEQYLTLDKQSLIVSKMEKTLQDNNDIRMYAYYASLFKRLWPAEHLPVTVSEDQLVTTLKEIQASFSQQDYMSSLELEYLRNVIIFHPNIQILVDQRKIDNLLEGNRQALITNSQNVNYFFLASSIADAKFISPKIVDNLTLEEKNGIREEVDKFNINDGPEMYAKTAANLKIIDPSFNPKLTPEQWTIMSTALKSDDGPLAIEMAYNMKILAAHKVEITAPGVIEFQMYPPEDVSGTIPKLPEQRKF